MELRRYLSLLIRWWWLILAGTVLSGAVAFMVTRSLPPIYRATATLYANQLESQGNFTYSDALLNQQLIKTDSKMIGQPVVLNVVRARNHLPYTFGQLQKMVTAQPVLDTQLLDISVQGSDPAQVRDIANSVAEVFIEQQTPYLPKGQASSALRIAQPALLPPSPVGPNVPLNTILAAFLGLMVTIGVVSLIEYLDDTVKTPDDLHEAAALVTLGAVMRMGAQDALHSAHETGSHPHSAVSEAFRLIRTNLQFASVDRPLTTLLVTSASPGEGKSTTVANLATVFAQSGKRVIVVDTDLRRPSVHRLFEVPNHRGLTNMLVDNDARIESHLQTCSVPGLLILPSGPLPPNPAELLASPRFEVVLEKLQAVSDLVILDSPPVIAVSDPIVLASRVDGTMLVVDTSRTRSDAVHQSCDALAKSGTRLLGGVLNKLSKRSGSYYDYYHYYNYGQDDKKNGRSTPSNGKVTDTVSVNPPRQRD